MHQENSVTYPNVAVIYDPIARVIGMMVVPGPGETARFVVPIGHICNILPSNDPYLLKEFGNYVSGIT